MIRLDEFDDTAKNLLREGKRVHINHVYSLLYATTYCANIHLLSIDCRMHYIEYIRIRLRDLDEYSSEEYDNLMLEIRDITRSLDMYPVSSIETNVVQCTSDDVDSLQEEINQCKTKINICWILFFLLYIVKNNILI